MKTTTTMSSAAMIAVVMFAGMACSDKTSSDGDATPADNGGERECRPGTWAHDDPSCPEEPCNERGEYV